jgi:hypothetical protein
MHIGILVLHCYQYFITIKYLLIFYTAVESQELKGGLETLVNVIRVTQEVTFFYNQDRMLS